MSDSGHDVPCPRCGDEVYRLCCDVYLMPKGLWSKSPDCQRQFIPERVRHPQVPEWFVLCDGRFSTKG